MHLRTVDFLDRSWESFLRKMHNYAWKRRFLWPLVTIIGFLFGTSFCNRATASNMYFSRSDRERWVC